MNAPDTSQLLAALKARFVAYRHRHPGVAWPDVEKRLKAAPAKLRRARFPGDHAGIGILRIVKRQSTP